MDRSAQARSQSPEAQTSGPDHSSKTVRYTGMPSVTFARTNIVRLDGVWFTGGGGGLPEPGHSQRLCSSGSRPSVLTVQLVEESAEELALRDLDETMSSAQKNKAIGDTPQSSPHPPRGALQASWFAHTR
jgi:hypothetical protein